MDYLETAFLCEGCSVEKVTTWRDATELLAESPDGYQALLLDASGVKQNRFQVIRELRASNPHLPIIVLSAALTQAEAQESRRAGATEYLSKPLRSEDLSHVGALARAFPLLQKRAQSVQESNPQILLGSSPGMQEARSILKVAGASSIPVLIRGETGSGKEVMARELHTRSPRANRPFVKLNCAALPSELVESELFGYERGAFTGAFQRKLGLFELADSGTIFLDEIGDMDIKLQAKLLQVLQDREFKRLGGKDTIRVDVRVVAATHRDLEKSILDGTFREDLYYRLAVVTMELPPLRERGEDILRLAELLLRKHSLNGDVPAITPPLRQALLDHNWPGNVRELENLMQRYLLFRNADTVIRDLRPRFRSPSPTQVNQAVAAAAASMAVAGSAFETLSAPTNGGMPAAMSPAPVAPMGASLSPLEAAAQAKDRAETKAILEALDAARWNRKQAARILNIDYKALLYRMKKLALEQTPVPIAMERPQPQA
ncbi:MAG: sigma-54-dependent Fis family transcriptional regulator [Bryobacterales bacterium]|nr:sigma-54-dependent Fis family transcriptional regulator [Bryobacterales bacterium]